MKFRSALAFILVSCILLMPGCNNNGSAEYNQNELKSGSYITRTGFYFDTVVSISIYSSSDESLLEKCMQLCRRYEDVFSPTSTKSELYLINNFFQNPENAGKKFEISYELYTVLKYVLPYCEMSGGRYDVTIRPVSEIWDFTSENPVPPDKSIIEDKLGLVDYNNIQISEADIMGITKYSISSSVAGVKLDLGSVAKGYISDCLENYLRDRGVTSAVISLGGNICCIGEKPSENGGSVPFDIGIQSPFGDSSQVYKVVEGHDNYIVTSGVYQRSFKYDDTLYHHILDANTGYPADNGLLSVTIISDSGMKADTLSTVCFLCGYEKSIQILNGMENTYAEFVYADNTVKTIGQ